MTSLVLNPKLTVKINKPDPLSTDPVAPGDAASEVNETDQQDKNDKLLNELMVLKFRIKLCHDLYMVGMKNTGTLKKKLNSVYQKKLKKYCELNHGVFDNDLVKQELNIKMDELTSELKKITGL